MRTGGRRCGSLAFAAGVLLAFALIAVARAAGAGEPLAAAVAAGKVTAVFRGMGASSGDAIQVTVSRTAKAGAGPLVLTVPAGARLRSATGSAQNMVVAGVRGRMVGGTRFAPSAEIVVPQAGPVTYVLEAYCSEFEKDNPSDATAFTLESPDPRLACILREGRGLSTEALQAAVWIHTDRVSQARLSQKFSVSPSDWARAQAVASKCSGAR